MKGRLVLVSLVIAAAAVAAVVSSPTAVPARAQLVNRLEAALLANGVNPEQVSVGVDGAEGQVVITTSAAADVSGVWARAIVEKEMARAKGAGETAIDWLTVEIVDISGRRLFMTRQPVEARPPSAAPPVDAAQAARVASYVAKSTSDAGVRLDGVEHLSDGRQVTLLVSLAVNEDKQEAQLRYVVHDLLPGLRVQAEGSGSTHPALYRLTITGRDSGRLLVDYVVDADRDSARVWSAEGVPKVWVLFEPWFPGMPRPSE